MTGELKKEIYYTTCEECEAVCEGEGELIGSDLHGLICPNCGEFDVLNWADEEEGEEG
jgi:hypothetical protein